MKVELKRQFEIAEEFLDDAKYLADDDRLNSAVNRAYYSVATIVGGLMLEKGLYIKTHSGLKTKFNELFIKNKILPLELGIILDDLFLMRQGADYDLSFDVTKEETLKAIEDAHIFISAIKSLMEGKS